MSTDTTSKSLLRSDRRTVTQLLAAAEGDTDAVSVFMAGCTVADTEAAIFVVKGPKRIAYLRSLCERQGLLTDKPVIADSHVPVQPTAAQAQPAPELSMLPSGNVLLRCADCVAYDPDATCRVCHLFVPKGQSAPEPAQQAVDSACRRSVWWTHNKAKFTTPRQAAFAAWDAAGRADAQPAGWRDLLTKLEWSSSGATYSYGPDASLCPCCGGFQVDGHTKDCELAAMLAARAEKGGT